MTNAMISSEEAQSYQSKGLSPRRRTYEVGMRGLLYLSAGITCLLLLFLIGYILYRGLPNLNWTFLTSQESVLRGTDGIMPAIQNTLYVIVVTLIFIREAFGYKEPLFPQEMLDEFMAQKLDAHRTR